MGWFYGCKLHVIMNAAGEMVNTRVSAVSTADLKAVEQLVSGLTDNSD